MARSKLLKYILEALGLLVLFTAIFAGSIYAYLRLSTRGEIIEVPNLVGKSVEDALKELNQLNLQLALSSEDYSNTIPRGRIISQVPEPSDKVKKGRTINITISRGIKQILLPDLSGKEKAEGLATLQALDLEMGNTVEVYSDRYDDGLVIATDPPKGTAVDEGDKISLLVSKGRSPYYMPMPDLIGETAQNAIDLLLSKDIMISRIDYELRAGLNEGIVIGQAPKPGSRILAKDNAKLTLTSFPGDNGEPSELYKIFEYPAPTGKKSSKISVVMIHHLKPDAVYSQACKPGDIIYVPVRVQTGAKVQILVDEKIVYKYTFQ